MDGSVPGLPVPLSESLLELEARVPALTAVEVEHYHWLIAGLLDGARRLIENRRGGDAAVVRAAIDEARDLFDEMTARIAAARP